MSAPGDYAPASITFLDAGNEISSLSVFGPLSDDTTVVVNVTAFNLMRTKAVAICLGVLAKSRYVTETIDDPVQPTNGAMRETKLLIQYKGATLGKRFTCTLPTLNPSNTIVTYAQNINAKDVVLIPSSGALHDFLTAFAAFAVSPEDPTEGVEVIGLKVVGRNI